MSASAVISPAMPNHGSPGFVERLQPSDDLLRLQLIEFQRRLPDQRSIAIGIAEASYRRAIFLIVAIASLLSLC